MENKTKEIKYLAPGYTMTDLGYITHILEHVRNPALTMVVEDFSSSAMLYQENYRDLPVEMMTCHDMSFDKRITDMVSKLTDLVFDTDFASEIEHLEETLPGLEAIDWGFHEPTLVPGHKYFCTLFLADTADEIKYLSQLLSQNHDSKEEFVTWYGNALKTMVSREITYPGVQMYRAIFWMEHLAMFTHDGCENPHADEWTSIEWKEILDQVVRKSFPFYSSDNFGSKKKKKDTWLVNKRKAGSTTHTKAPGRIMDDAPVYSGGFKMCKSNHLTTPRNNVWSPKDRPGIWQSNLKVVYFIPGKLILGKIPSYVVPEHRPRKS